MLGMSMFILHVGYLCHTVANSNKNIVVAVLLTNSFVENFIILTKHVSC